MHGAARSAPTPAPVRAARATVIGYRKMRGWNRSHRRGGNHARTGQALRCGTTCPEKSNGRIGGSSTWENGHDRFAADARRARREPPEATPFRRRRRPHSAPTARPPEAAAWDGAPPAQPALPLDRCPRPTPGPPDDRRYVDSATWSATTGGSHSNRGSYAPAHLVWVGAGIPTSQALTNQ